MFNLPSEVQTKVLQFLNKKDLQTCFSVCKSWQHIAIPLFYKEVTIRSSGIRLLKAQLKENDYKKYFKCGQIVRKLSILDDDNVAANIIFHGMIKADEKNKFTRQEWLLLLNQFHNLTVINIQNSSNIDEYLEFLLDANLPYINKVYTGPSYDLTLYFSVCYKFRESISHLNLYYNQKTRKLGTQDINIVDSLKDFKHLETLEFHNCFDYNLSPLKIQENCPNLKNLSYKTEYPLSEELMQISLNDGVSFNFPKNILRLELTLPSLSNAYTQYLIDYFPNQLNMLKIDTLNQDLFDWIDTIGTENALKLMEKIGKIKNVDIKFQSSYKYELNVESRMTKFFRLLYAYRGNTNIYFNVNLDGPDENYNSNHYSFKNESDGYLYIRFKLYEDDFDQNTNFLKLPDKSVSVIGLEVLSILGFDFSRWNKDTLYDTLKYVLEYCPNIQALDLICNSCSFNENRSWNESIASDENYEIDDWDPVITYMHTGDLKASDITRNEINFLQMDFIRSTSNYFYLINKYLPNIETFTFYDDDKGDRVIGLTGFKKLKNFTYFIEDNRGRRENKIILFEFTNGECQYFCCQKVMDQFTSVNYSEDSPIIPNLTLLCDKSVNIKFYRNDNIMEFIYE